MSNEWLSVFCDISDYFCCHLQLKRLLEPKYCAQLGNFPNSGQKIQSCLFWLKIGTHGMLEVLILNLQLDFWISNPITNFQENLGQKSQSYSFCLKIGTHGISRMLNLILTLVFWISNPKFISGKILTKTVKVLFFVWKMACVVSQGYWFLFRN